MPKPVAPKLSIPPRVSQLLEDWTQQYTGPTYRAERAEILLIAAQGVPNYKIADQLELNPNTISKWRRRYAEKQEYFQTLVDDEVDQPQLRDELDALLSDAQRPGRPPKFEPEDVVRIVRLSCSDPAELGLPWSHWTPPALARQAVQQGIVDSISSSTVRRFLKRS